MKIKVKLFDKGLLPPSIIDKGDWIDLQTRNQVVCHSPKINEEGEIGFNSMLIPLNVAIEVPKGYECIVAPRSSTFKKFGIVMTNSIGIIDNSYCGDNDEWLMSVLCTQDIVIPKATRIAQFKVQLSQKATIWQKIKWLFTNKIEIKVVSQLNNINREGFGSTDKKD